MLARPKMGPVPVKPVTQKLSELEGVAVSLAGCIVSLHSTLMLMRFSVELPASAKEKIDKELDGASARIDAVLDALDRATDP